MRPLGLDVPNPSPSTPFLTLEASDRGSCAVEYDSVSRAERVRLRFTSCIEVRMGSSCEGAGRGVTVGEVVESDWLSARRQAARLGRGADAPSLSHIRHFFIVGHDMHVEVLAAGWEVEPPRSEVSFEREVVRLAGTRPKPSGTRQSDLGDQVLDVLRARYLAGYSVPALIRELCESSEITSPFEVMYALMDAFHVGLGDVSCIDGWWPPDQEAEVSDAKLDRSIRDAIEARRAEWIRDP